MKRIFLILLVLAQLIGLGACASPAPETPTEPQPTVTELDSALWKGRPLQMSDGPARVWYDLTVETFCDGDGDGTGDLQGITGKLDYLRELGVTGIAMNSLLSPDSFTELNPAYGTPEDLKTLVNQGLQRGIRLMMDLPLSTTSRQHEWFQTAVRYLQSLPATEEPDLSACPQVAHYFLDRTGGEGFSPVPGTGWFYRHGTDGESPLLNTENKAVRDGLEEAAAHWLELGIYGFRLRDADALHSVPESAADFLTVFCGNLKRVHPDSVFLADTEANAALFSETGIDGIPDNTFRGREGIFAGILEGGSASAYGRHHLSQSQLTTLPVSVYTDAASGSSARWFGDDGAKIKLGLAMNLLMPGSVFLRAGEELGVRSNGDTVMPWSESDYAAGMCTVAPAGQLPFGTLEQQLADENSIYSFVMDVLRLRHQNPALTRGETALVQEVSGKTVCAMTKALDGTALLVLLNPTGEAQTVALSGLTAETQEPLGVLLTGTDAVLLEEQTITLPAHSLLLLGTP